MDYNFVTERVATGGAITSPDDVKQLIDAGITDVIDCRSEFDDAPLFLQYSNVHYVNLGVEDNGQPKATIWFQQGIDFAFDALSKPHRKVYAHCAAGQNRGPSMCYAILLALGLDPNLAENLIRTARPQVTLAYKGDALRATRELGYQNPLVGSAFGEIEK